MLVPNAENATVDIRKLRDYCLNPNHDEGKHKARLFGAIGIGSSDADELKNRLIAAVKVQEAQTGRLDEFGQRYIVDVPMDWRGKQITIRSGWIVEFGSETPRLTTCYPL